jgi:hypothetical protein
MSKVSRERRDSRNVSAGHTSRYAPFRFESKGKPPALRNLAWSELGLIIQTGEHSRVEDGKQHSLRSCLIGLGTGMGKPEETSILTILLNHYPCLVIAPVYLLH